MQKPKAIPKKCCYNYLIVVSWQHLLDHFKIATIYRPTHAQYIEPNEHFTCTQKISNVHTTNTQIQTQKANER